MLQAAALWASGLFSRLVVSLDGDVLLAGPLLDRALVTHVQRLALRIILQPLRRLNLLLLQQLMASSQRVLVQSLVYLLPLLLELVLRAWREWGACVTHLRARARHASEVGCRTGMHACAQRMPWQSARDAPLITVRCCSHLQPL